MHLDLPASPSDAVPAIDAAPWTVVTASADWHCVDFISDLHLNRREPATLRAWQHYLAHTTAQAVFQLGDLFDVWLGDDALDTSAGASSASGADEEFERVCATTLRDASSRVDLFFMRGNRDFLLGHNCASTCGMRLLPDPCLLDFAAERWLLSHGDALCLADTDYMAFRAQVRGLAWQQQFLARTMAERRAIAADLRQRSEARKRSAPAPADVDAIAAADWLRRASARTMLHGHTHRPADHALPDGMRRIVLSDWDLHANPPRAQVLRISTSDGHVATLRRLSLHQACAANG